MLAFPRRLALILFSAGNISYGISTILDPQRTAAYTHVPGPLQAWGAAFITIGVAVLLSVTSIERLAAVAVGAVMIWLAWATFSVEAHISHPHVVTLKGPVLLTWVASLHFLLSPYRRRPG